MRAAKRPRSADPVNHGLKSELSTSYRRLGTAAYVAGDPVAASAASERAVTFAGAASAGDPADRTFLIALGAALGDRGQILGFEGRSASSLAYAAKAIEIFERASKLDPTDRAAKRSLSAMYDRAATEAEVSAVTPPKREQALAWHRKGLAAAMELAASDPNDGVAESMVGVDHNGVGESLMLLQRVPAAIEEYAAGKRVFDTMIVKDPEDSELRYDRTIVMSNLANALLVAGRDADALETLKSALASAVQLPGRATNAYYQSGEATLTLRMGHAYAALASKARAADRAEQWRKAEGWYRRGNVVYVDLQRRGVLQAEDTRYLQESVAGLARCKTELARLAARDSK